MLPVSWPVYTFINELSLSVIRKLFKQICLYTILLQGKSILIDQIAKLSCFQKSKYYAGIKIFNIVPPSVTNIKNDKTKFKVPLRKYLYTHSFYSVDEFFYV